MRIIGWDIGIKNLSYCIFDTENTNDYKEYFEFEERQYFLVDWKVINLIPNIERGENEIILSSREEKTCSNITTTKKGKEKPCNAKAKFVGWYHNNPFENISFFCGKHKNVNSDNYYLGDISKKGVDCCVEKDCNTNGVYVNKKNLYYGYCRKHYNKLIKESELSENDVFKIIKEKKADKNNLTLLAEALYKELDKYPQILDTSCVLFENQPVLKNPTMKSMQIFLYGYYMMKGYMSNESDVNEIHCYNANKKIETQYFVAEEDLKEINDSVSKLKSKYTQTKKKGIALVEYFFSNNYTDENPVVNFGESDIPRKIQVFEDKKKRDDLADSFLMTIHYLEKKRIAQLKKHAL